VIHNQFDKSFRANDLSVHFPFFKKLSVKWTFRQTTYRSNEFSVRQPFPQFFSVKWHFLKQVISVKWPFLIFFRSYDFSDNGVRSTKFSVKWRLVKKNRWNYFSVKWTRTIFVRWWRVKMLKFTQIHIFKVQLRKCRMVPKWNLE
jgi:hypothetical protein